jgi:hypothetical protein
MPDLPNKEIQYKRARPDESVRAGKGRMLNSSNEANRKKIKIRLCNINYLSLRDKPVP